jgi:uncharacterized integral membrane protein
MPSDSKIPHGSDEWGRLLYEEEWVKERRTKYPGALIVLIMMLFTSVIIFILAFVNKYYFSPPFLQTVAMILFGFIFLILCVYGIVLQTKIMPFRIYESGVTRVIVPFSQGLWRKEVLIPKDSISSIDLEPGIGKNPAIVINFEDVNNKDDEMLVSSAMMRDPDAPLWILDEVMSEKLSPGLKRYIEK